MKTVISKLGKEEKGPPKNQFLKASSTLRKLQTIHKIPRSIKQISLDEGTIHYSNAVPDQNYLLVTTGNQIYYGKLNPQGIPETHFGICIFPDGSYYEGIFKDGKQNGQGLLTNIECTFSYNGEWKNGMPDGYGEQKIQQNVYVGQFSQGHKHGSGKQTYSDKSYYEGEFKNNVIEGHGKFYSQNNYWEGNWVNGYLEGQGKQIIAKQNLKDLKNAAHYHGNFEKGERQGHGSFKWSNKYEYDGGFKKGQLHGEGMFKFKGKVYAGIWSDGTEIKISQAKSSIQKPSGMEEVPQNIDEQKSQSGIQ